MKLYLWILRLYYWMYCTVKCKAEPGDNEAVPVGVEALPMYGEDKYSTVLGKMKLNLRIMKLYHVEAVPMDGEDKYCTVNSKTEPVDNEIVPVDVEAVPVDGEELNL